MLRFRNPLEECHRLRVYLEGDLCRQLSTEMGWDKEMKQDAANILREALKLPPEARAALAGTLLDSLDDMVDEDTEAAWQAEILMRLQDVDNGRVRMVPWAEARRQMAGQ